MDSDNIFEKDKAWTKFNRTRLFNNKNLLYWYEKLYERQFNDVDDIESKKILEVGSGTSPLKIFYNNIITSDIIDLEYLDYKLDCHKIDEFDYIANESLDIVTLINVLHHLRDPLSFLTKASIKLKQGGQIIMVEPYFSSLSKLVYRYLHHEPSVFEVDEPLLQEIKGPLSSANMAIPYMIFFSNKNWSSRLSLIYNFSPKSVAYFSSLSYMATGGISRKLPIPGFLYKNLFKIDLWLANIFPRLLSSFFIMKLTKK
ncbi:MAG: methyltransferase domain-containing protein [Proteobacteria bacterium]|nr:methyltransferase domain-containing protein [Pseudomonadota bacterium]